MKRLTKLEAVLWSVALPGFSQLLAGSYIKGILFIILEFLINVNSNFNDAIRYSFLGEFESATNVIEFGWLMFYPCLYMFAMWDAYRMAMRSDEKFAYLPFVFGAYFITVGLMLSTKIHLFGLYLGPIFLPMLSLLPGLLVGFLLRFCLLKLYPSPPD
ncbi:hypothetical protein [Mesobacillus harenae]|uniref:hypothetical protein n=1 Tax=Mesobacillus harenae TaxID=2213203 RepID=UPI0015809516